MVPEVKRDGHFVKERSMVRAMCGIQFKDRVITDDIMWMSGLNEAIDQMAIASSVHWYGHVLKREDGDVLRRALDCEVEGQRNRGRPMRTWMKQDEEEREAEEDLDETD